MTERKPALKRYDVNSWGMMREEDEGDFLFASEIHPAILNATKEELAALAVFAEAMPELLKEWPNYTHASPLMVLQSTMDAALAAAKGLG